MIIDKENGLIQMAVIEVGEGLFSQIIKVTNQSGGSFKIHRLTSNQDSIKNFIKHYETACYIFYVTGSYDPWQWIKIIKENNPAADILCLSKKKDFTEVYKGFNYRITNFLVEPIEDRDFANALSEIQERQSALQVMNSDLNRLQVFELQQQQKLMEQIMMNLLEKPDELALMAGEVKERYDIEVTGDRYLGIVLGVSKGEFYLNRGDRVDQLLKVFRSALSKFGEAITSRHKRYGLTAVLNLYDHVEVTNIEQHFDQLYQTIRGVEEISGTLPNFIIGLGHTVDDMKLVEKSLENGMLCMTETALRSRSDGRPFIKGEDDQGKKCMNAVSELKIPFTLKNRLKKALWRFDCKALDAWFPMVLVTCDWIYDNSQLYHGFLDWVESLTMEVFTSKGVNESWTNHMALVSIHGLCDVQNCLDLLCERLTSFCKMISKDVGDAENETMALVLEYMDEHYAQSLSLEILSDEVGWSGAYLSTRFKELVGETYLEHLTDLRIQRAENLLKDTNHTIKVIAEEIGYLDHKHFSKLFKKYHDMTPGVYRKAHKVEEVN